MRKKLTKRLSATFAEVAKYCFRHKGIVERFNSLFNNVPHNGEQNVSPRFELAIPINHGPIGVACLGGSEVDIIGPVLVIMSSKPGLVI